jgi:hypothetical protein
MIISKYSYLHKVFHSFSFTTILNAALPRDIDPAMFHDEVLAGIIKNEYSPGCDLWF